MRRVVLTVTLILGLSSAARADEVANQLEALMKPQTHMKYRFISFFKKHRVRHPGMYAQLLVDHPMPEHQKKIMAAILVPESRGRCDVVSSEGAVGPWQVMPRWKRVLKIKGSLKNPQVCLNAAVQVYDIHFKDARGDERRTLHAYSGGSKWYPRRIQSLVRDI